MVAPTITPMPPAPDRGDGGTQFDIDATVFAAAFALLVSEINASASFVDTKATEALAAALSGDLPPLAGQALKLLRVNAGETAAEFFELVAATTAALGLVEKATAGEGTTPVPDKFADVVGIAAMIAERGFSGQLLHVRDEKASGTAGGTFTFGAWLTRTLNTMLTNEISGASVAANQITLPAGTYYIDVLASRNRVGENLVKLYNVSDASDVLIGMVQKTGATYGDVNGSCLSGRFTIAAEKVFEIQHRGSDSRSLDGFGVAAGFGVVEVYADVKLWKVA